jgi:hypothetical protein
MKVKPTVSCDMIPCSVVDITNVSEMDNFKYLKTHTLNSKRKKYEKHCKTFTFPVTGIQIIYTLTKLTYLMPILSQDGVEFTESVTTVNVNVIFLYRCHSNKNEL